MVSNDYISQQYLPPQSSSPSLRFRVENVMDALMLVEASRLGLVARMKTRLSDSYQRGIEPGTAFIYDEEESRIKRWTDGMSWSAGRVSGAFLVYKEQPSKQSPKNRFFFKKTLLIDSHNGRKYHLVYYGMDGQSYPKLNDLPRPLEVFRFKIRKSSYPKLEIAHQLHNQYPDFFSDPNSEFKTRASNEESASFNPDSSIAYTQPQVSEPYQMSNHHAFVSQYPSPKSSPPGVNPPPPLTPTAQSIPSASNEHFQRSQLPPLDAPPSTTYFPVNHPSALYNDRSPHFSSSNPPASLHRLPAPGLNHQSADYGFRSDQSRNQPQHGDYYSQHPSQPPQHYNPSHENVSVKRRSSVQLDPLSFLAEVAELGSQKEVEAPREAYEMKKRRFSADDNGFESYNDDVKKQRCHSIAFLLN
ncbi:Gti1/Pac2 family-domain-containing protein [Paraphysoderma sedebokerense]|nr:Gti1/Pac2 family-domain-containing protein [Paraphysoderma sedebokerense]